jgi:hypothetical protein
VTTTEAFCVFIFGIAMAIIRKLLIAMAIIQKFINRHGDYSKNY